MFKVSIHFLCNFKPNIKISKKSLKKKIFCKNFILFLMFINFSKVLNTSIFIKPLKKKRLIFLKAPHRNKTSMHTFCFSPYSIILSVNPTKKDKFFKKGYEHNYFKNFGQIITFINSLKKIFIKIDSSICSQKTISLELNSFFNKEFFFINFN